MTEPLVPAGLVGTVMAKSESQKLSILADISQIISQSHDLEETLNNIVTVVSERMDAQACSIYLVDAENEHLTLSATVGLDQASVGKVQMKFSEGLTGLVVQEERPVSESEASSHPRYKFFPETHEEVFHSYLGVPLLERRRVIGVLAVQTVESRDFNNDDVRMLETIASQVTGLITTARMLAELQEKAEYYQHLEDEIRRYEKPSE